MAAPKKRRPTLAKFECPDHGKRPIALVCAHLPKATGFHAGRVTRMNPWPDTWCNACDRVYAANGRRWTAALREKTDWVIICSGCYEALRDR